MLCVGRHKLFLFKSRRVEVRCLVQFHVHIVCLSAKDLFQVRFIGRRSWGTNTLCQSSPCQLARVQARPLNTLWRLARKQARPLNTLWRLAWIRHDISQGTSFWKAWRLACGFMARPLNTLTWLWSCLWWISARPLNRLCQSSSCHMARWRLA